MPARTAITLLRLSEFRNLAALELAGGEGMVVITGPNGAGKNQHSRSAFPARHRARLARGELGAAYPAGRGQRLGGGGGNLARRGHVPPGHRPSSPALKSASTGLEGEPLRGQGELAGLITLLWQTPQMDGLFTETGSARRHYFDRITSAFNPGHASNLARYDYARRERARLLEQRRGDASWLESLERKMAESTLAIAAARVETAQRLQAAMLSLPPAFPQAEIRLLGTVGGRVEPSGALRLCNWKMRWRCNWNKTRAADAASGRSATGAHRTELQVHLTEKTRKRLFAQRVSKRRCCCLFCWPKPRLLPLPPNRLRCCCWMKSWPIWTRPAAPRFSRFWGRLARNAGSPERAGNFSLNCTRRTAISAWRMECCKAPKNPAETAETIHRKNAKKRAFPPMAGIEQGQ